jgi:hypothetical protein
MDVLGVAYRIVIFLKYPPPHHYHQHHTELIAVCA